jgi:heme-degrading monooxygenase HmoA
MTIERVWSARASSPDAAATYASYFARVVMPELAAVPGYRGCRLLQRAHSAIVEIVVATQWESMDAIRGFAGDDVAHAVVHDEAAALFADFDRTVRHFEVVIATDDPV